MILASVLAFVLLGAKTKPKIPPPDDILVTCQSMFFHEGEMAKGLLIRRCTVPEGVCYIFNGRMSHCFAD